MTAANPPLLNFERILRAEADRVLSDVIFHRSPIQARLLKYLVERTCDGGPAPSQYEVAVDGLGRDPNYDLSSDSYPRVQVSRLRRNLNDYYSRNLPHSGMRIAISSSAYKLELVPSESSKDAGPKPVASDASGGRLLEKQWLLAASALAMAAILTWFFLSGSDADTQASGSTQRPAVALSVNPTNNTEPSAAIGPASELAKQIAEIQLTNSLVSNFGGPALDNGSADYTLAIRFAVDSRENDIASLSLTNPEGTTLYSNMIPYQAENRGDFVAELEATIAFLTAPNGLIARQELNGVKDRLATDFLCFLSIESERGEGDEVAAMVDTCLTRHPESDFAAYWYSRRAYATFQSDVVAQMPLEKDGDAWRDLQNAFDIDPTNIFANFLAAKVELADDDCDAAASYVSTVVERGNSYPALIAATETDASRCAALTGQQVFDIDRAQQIAQYTPSPEPLLHLNLILAAVAMENRALARNLAQKVVIKNPETPVEKTGALIGRSVESSDFAGRRRQDIAANLRPFVWNEAMIDQMVSSLANG